MTNKDIKKLFNKIQEAMNDDEDNQFEWPLDEDNIDDFKTKYKDLFETYNVNIHLTGGVYRDGGDIYTIYEVSKGKEKCFAKLEGWYSSWDSSGYEDTPYLAEPVEVKVIEWRKKK